MDSETIIATKEGFKKIKNIHIGDIVYTLYGDSIVTLVEEYKDVEEYVYEIINYSGECITISSNSYFYIKREESLFFCKISDIKVTTDYFFYTLPIIDEDGNLTDIVRGIISSINCDILNKCVRFNKYNKSCINYLRTLPFIYTETDLYLEYNIYDLGFNEIPTKNIPLFNINILFGFLLGTFPNYNENREYTLSIKNNFYPLKFILMIITGIINHKQNMITIPKLSGEQDIHKIHVYNKFIRKIKKRDDMVFYKIKLKNCHNLLTINGVIHL